MSSIKSKTNQTKVTIKIPRPLYEKISQVIDNSGYNSVTDFIVYVLRDLMASRNVGVNTDPTADELTHVKQHLHALGYLDIANEQKTSN